MAHSFEGSFRYKLMVVCVPSTRAAGTNHRRGIGYPIGSLTKIVEDGELQEEGRQSEVLNLRLQRNRARPTVPLFPIPFLPLPSPWLLWYAHLKQRTVSSTWHRLWDIRGFRQWKSKQTGPLVAERQPAVLLAFLLVVVRFRCGCLHVVEWTLSLALVPSRGTCSFYHVRFPYTMLQVRERLHNFYSTVTGIFNCSGKFKSKKTTPISEKGDSCNPTTLLKPFQTFWFRLPIFSKSL